MNLTGILANNHPTLPIQALQDGQVVGIQNYINPDGSAGGKQLRNLNTGNFLHLYKLLSDETGLLYCSESAMLFGGFQYGKFYRAEHSDLHDRLSYHECPGTKTVEFLRLNDSHDNKIEMIEAKQSRGINTITQSITKFLHTTIWVWSVICNIRSDDELNDTLETMFTAANARGNYNFQAILVINDNTLSEYEALRLREYIITHPDDLFGYKNWITLSRILKINVNPDNPFMIYTKKQAIEKAHLAVDFP